MGPEVDNDIVVDVSDGGNFMPSDDFKYPTAVVIKTGGGPNEQHFIYSPAGSFDCDFQVGKDPYCVAFEDDGSFTVTLNPCYALVGAKNNCQPAHGISHIQIWKNGEDVDICECRELGVAAVTNGNCVCDGPDDPDDPGDPGDPGDPDTPVTSSGTPGVSASVPVSAPLAGEEATLIPVTGADYLASLQAALRNLGMVSMGVSFLSTGIQRKMKR